MRTRAALICASVVLMAGALSAERHAQAQPGDDVRALLVAVSKNIGADNLTTLEYKGSGWSQHPARATTRSPS